MAIYRAEQARMSFSSEAAPGGYMEIIDTMAAQTSSPGNTSLNGAHTAGSRSLTVAAITNFAVGQYVLIEAAGTAVTETRRIIQIGGTTTLFLDYPTGFPHATSTAVVEKLNTSPTGSTYTAADTGGSPQGTAGDGGINFATFLPGVYETITTPDVTPEFLPQYFLKDSSDRNWSYMYRGKQTFNGSLSNILLLNGQPLKYAFGKVATTAASLTNADTLNMPASGSGSSAVLAGSFVGDRVITLTSATDYDVGKYIQVGVTTLAEVRQIVAVSGNILTLNYPLMIAHANGAATSEVTAGPYTHTMQEDSKLPTMTWNVLMRDSDETADNDFIRRYVGGICNRATLSGAEGEMLRYSWDDVQFLDLVHNQTRHSAIDNGNASAPDMDKSSNMLLSPLGIGADMPYIAPVTGNQVLDTPVYPTTEPYYYSQGTLSFFGVEFARIRSFSLDMSNNVEARYYMNNKGGKRIPSEFQEARREYSFTASIALPDSFSASSTVKSLWKELILEGNYAGVGNTAALQGFDMSLTFTRGTNDTITLTSPYNTTGSNDAATTFDKQGCFFTRASHPISSESPLQVDGEITMRNMKLVVVDSIPVYA
jgi:hypothetical protein